MTGETERSPSGWTPDTLKVLEDEKISALETFARTEFNRVDERHQAFAATAQREAEKQNEFRGALDDVNKLKADRRELEAMTARMDDLAHQLGDLRSRLDIGPAGLAAVQTAQATAIGRQQGVGVSTGFIVAAITISVGVIGVVVAVANVLTR